MSTDGQTPLFRTPAEERLMEALDVLAAKLGLQSAFPAGSGPHFTQEALPAVSAPVVAPEAPEPVQPAYNLTFCKHELHPSECSICKHPVRHDSPQRRNPEAYVMKAKLRTHRCPACGEPIEPGDWIGKDDDGSWVHSEDIELER